MIFYLCVKIWGKGGERGGGSVGGTLTFVAIYKEGSYYREIPKREEVLFLNLCISRTLVGELLFPPEIQNFFISNYSNKSLGYRNIIIQINS